MRPRHGLSLVEVLVAIFVVSVLIAVLLPSIDNLRALALRTQSAVNLKSIMLAMHQHAVDHNNNLPSFGRRPSDVHLYYSLLPYLDADYCKELNNIVARRDKREIVPLPNFKDFLDPADKSIDFEYLRSTKAGPINMKLLQPGKWPAWPTPDEYFSGHTSYAANYHVFGTPMKLTTDFGDGTANTIAFGQHYAVIRHKVQFPGAQLPATERLSHCLWEDPRAGGMTNNLIWRDIVQHWSRAGCFAAFRPGNQPYDEVFCDVYPITKDHMTTGSIPNLHFQVTPQPDEADPRICQSPHHGGMLVAMADASVRFMAPTIKPEVFWSLVTPNGNEQLTNEWLDLSPEITCKAEILPAGQRGQLVFPSKKEPSLFDAETIFVSYSIMTPMGQSLRSHGISDPKKIREILLTIEIKEPEFGTQLPANVNAHGRFSLEFPGNKFTGYMFLQKDKLRRSSGDFDGPDGYVLRSTKLYEKLCEVCSEIEKRPIDVLQHNK
jgi:prepilin-type N-terminal cleavage/methylation domain-containing protein